MIFKFALYMHGKTGLAPSGHMFFFFIIIYLFLKHIYYKHMHISDMNMTYNVQTSY